jgi:hypothetical protein
MIVGSRQPIPMHRLITRPDIAPIHRHNFAVPAHTVHWLLGDFARIGHVRAPAPHWDVSAMIDRVRVLVSRDEMFTNAELERGPS